MKTLHFLCFINFILLSKYFFLENGEKSLQSGGFREVQSGYSKHSFFFSFALACKNSSAEIEILCDSLLEK